MNSVIKHKAYWKINNLCNFQCEYCFYENHIEHPLTNKHTPKEIVNAFDRTGETWEIEIDGGEPFLYPGFVDLLEKLTINHYVVIVTNLSRTKEIIDFSERISPEKVLRIGASIHITERMRRNEVDKYIDNFLLLKSKGFNIDATYVCYPAILPQILQDYQFFKSRGVTFFPAIFQGVYNGKEYPESFTEEERSLIKSISIETNVHMDLTKAKASFRGYYCHAGSKLIDINEAGNVIPCVSAGVYKNITLGNIFENKSKLLTKKRVCTFQHCLCPPQGLEFAETTKANPLELLTAKIKDDLQNQKQKLNRVLGRYVYWRFNSVR